MSCPQEPIPAGWKVWRGPVPTELTQLAMDTRDRVLSYPYGSVARTVTYNGQNVGVFVSHHTWTYRGGQLVTGICIPGCSLIVQQPPGSAGASVQDSLATPDPSAAVYGADDVTTPAPAPPATTNWGLVALSGAAIAGVVGLFLLGLHHAGKAARDNPTAIDNPPWYSHWKTRKSGTCRVDYSGKRPKVRHHELCTPGTPKCPWRPVICSGPHRHDPRCRLGRPLCRWMRRRRRICTCNSYSYPHRLGGGYCPGRGAHLYGDVPAAIRSSPTYRMHG